MPCGARLYPVQPTYQPTCNMAKLQSNYDPCNAGRRIRVMHLSRNPQFRAMSPSKCLRSSASLSPTRQAGQSAQEQ